MDQADEIAAQIVAAKPSAVGLAMKAYLFLYDGLLQSNHEGGAAVKPGDLFNGKIHPAGEVALATSILRDAVAFVPELAPLTEAVLAAAK